MKQGLISVISLALLTTVLHAQEENKAETPAPEQPASEATPAPQAPAPQAPAPKAEEGAKAANKPERISVTGSRIKKIDVESSNTIQTYSREDIVRSGQSTVADFVRSQLPSTGTLTSETQTLSNTAGSASFGGRDVEAVYTLVLVNGRRLPNNAIDDSFVDLNLIPMAAVERIEYITNGASAIYGSDAVAGVLNIITKKEYSGTNVTAKYGTSARNDGTETSLQVVTGINDDSGSFLVAGETFKREPVNAINRPLIKSAKAPNGLDGRSPNGLPGYIIRADGNLEPFPDCPKDNINEAGQCTYDFAPLYESIPKNERQSIYSIFERKLTDGIQFYGEARFARTYTLTANGAAPGGVTLSGDAPSNPYPGEQITLIRRYIDFGPRQNDNINQAFSMILGLKGTILNDYNWEFSVGKHRLENKQLGRGGLIRSTAAEKYFNDGTLNPFIYNTFDTPEKIAARKEIEAETFRVGESDLETYNLGFDGSVPGLLPGGDLGFAFGFEYRQEAFQDRSDVVTAADEILGGSGGNGKGDQDNKAVYVELSLPVVKQFELSLAGRHDRIADKDSATTVRTGVTYRLIDEVMLRGSYSTGFKAPSLNFKYLGQSFGVQTAKDPYACREFGLCENFELNTRSGGNQDLKPETSTFTNFGTVLQPLAAVSVNVDYWNLQIKDKVGLLELQEVMNNEATYASFINRVNGRVSGSQKGAGFVLLNYQNLTKQESSGLDIGSTYNAAVGPGRLTGSLRLNKLLLSKKQTSPTQPLCDDSKDIKGVDGSASVDYSLDAVKGGISFLYYSSMDAYSGGYVGGTCDRAEPESRVTVDPYSEFGLNASYTAPFGTTFIAGVQNVADAAPPFNPYRRDGTNTWPWYDQGRFNNMGRFFYLTVNHEFQ